jgi:hypothetical protein
VPYQVENCSGSGAVEPVPGERFALEWPPLHPVNVPLFLQAFTHHDQATGHLVRLDHGRGQTATSLVIPEPLGCLFVPPDSPERNPIARRWPEVKPPFAWVLVSALDEWEHHVERLLHHYSNAAIRSRTADPSVVQAVQALCS